MGIDKSRFIVLPNRARTSPSKTTRPMVPSGKNVKVAPTGTITCLDRVCFRGGKTKNRVIGRKTQIITTQAFDDDNRRQNRPRSPVCGDPALDEAAGRMETYRSSLKPAAAL